ncbi:MAG: hypothetical protein IEMM0002_0861 [bacterium]|nr:MAG: hypothetical protein IEMM0002_0861 [bacterium]
MRMTNKIFSIWAMIALFCIGVSRPASAEDILVIVNKVNPVNSLTADDIKRFYKNIDVSWEWGATVNLFDLPLTNDARRDFSEKLLGKSAMEVATYWANKKITNTAKNPPTSLKSETLMLTKVATDAGAIGYVSKSKVNSQVKVVFVIK